MGNYRDMEYDFIDRTLRLTEQYEGILANFDFKNQFNYTLLFNCLLGMIVMPKERVISVLPNERLTKDVLKHMGIVNSRLDAGIKTIKELIVTLRHSIAHFNIEVISVTDDFLIDRVIFSRDDNGGLKTIADFDSKELLPFIHFLGEWIKNNIVKSLR